MNIFEQLENLNVSEECFNDIIDIAEDLLSYAYAQGKGKKLERKIKRARNNEMRIAIRNEIAKGYKPDEAMKRIVNRRSQWNTAAGKDLKQTIESQGLKKDNKEIATDLKRNIKKINKEALINSLNSLYKDKKATEEAGSAHSDAMIDQNKKFHESLIEDIISIIEEYINEVSIKRWRQAAINSIPTRIADVRKKEEEYDDDDDDNEDAFNKLCHAEDRLGYAEFVANHTNNSKKPANSHWINVK